jgi:hypothetical protein
LEPVSVMGFFLAEISGTQADSARVERLKVGLEIEALR